MGSSTEYLSFGLASERYALPIVKVREIIGLPPVTRMPNAPSYFRGVINLRGAIVPLVDLREEFGLPNEAYSKFTVVIIGEVQGTVVGLIVDRVIDVAHLSESEIRTPPAQLTNQVKAEFISGLAEVEKELLVLLDLDRILTDEKLGILRGAGAA